MRESEDGVKICCPLYKSEYVVTMVNCKLPLNNLQMSFLKDSKNKTLMEIAPSCLNEDQIAILDDELRLPAEGQREQTSCCQ